jgi:uncharacterized membrane protein YbaN (DUF454 family)
MVSTPMALKKPANGFVRVMRRIYSSLGFSKGYNAILGEFARAILPYTPLTSTSSIPHTRLSPRFHPRQTTIPILQQRILQP